MDVRNAVEMIAKVAEEQGYRWEQSEDVSYLRLYQPGSIVVVNLRLQQDHTALAYLFIRTRSWDWPGDRTDLHEGVSVLMACFLRTTPPCISPTLIDVSNPAVQMGRADVYARFLTLTQPDNGIYQLNAGGFSAIQDLLRRVAYSELLVRSIVDWDHRLEATASPVAAEAWATEVAQAAGVHRMGHLDDDDIYLQRVNPTWSYYKSARRGISVWKSPRMAEGLHAWMALSAHWQNIQGINATLFVGNGVSNAISNHGESRLRNLVVKLDSSLVPEDFQLVPFENYFVAVAGSIVIAMRSNCGRKRFEDERESVRIRHEHELAVLFPAVFVWQDPLDDEQFELLVLALLNREPGVVWARKVGSSNEPDGGRDITCEWRTPVLPHEPLSVEKEPFLSRRVVVQCKASKASVGKSDVRDIRDTVEHHCSDGYFLAVASHITRGLTEHLEQLRLKGRIWTDWWTRSEIEDRLRRNPDIATGFERVVKVT